MALGNLLIRTLAPAALCALAVSACGSQQKPQAKKTTASKPPTHNNHAVVIYSSLPQGGPERSDSEQIVRGINLAISPFAHKPYRGFHISYRQLNDSRRLVCHRHAPNSPNTRDKSSSGIASTCTGNTDGWNGPATVRAAERAARNPETVAYIGDLDSGATELSLPILNQAGILQITPGSGYPGLTDSYKDVTLGTAPPEPGRYYPHHPPNLLRLIPNDVVEAGAALSLLHAGGCATFSVWRFSDGVDATENKALQTAVIHTAPEYGMKYVAPPKSLGAETKSYQSYYSYWKLLEPDDLRCLVFVGHVSRQAVAFATEMRLQLPSAPIVGTSGFCTRAWLDGIPKTYLKNVEAGLYCMTPARPVSDYPGTKGSEGFIAKFRRAYHRRPNAYAYYGYEAAAMVMRALEQITSGEDNRQQVLLQLAGEFPSGASAPFTFDSGDVNSTKYGVDDFKNGAPRPYRTVTPTYYLLPSG